MALIRTNNPMSSLNIASGYGYKIGIDNTPYAFPISGAYSNRWIGIVGNVKGYSTLTMNNATASALTWASGITNNGNVVSLGKIDGASGTFNVSAYDYVICYSIDGTANTITFSLS